MHEPVAAGTDATDIGELMRNGISSLSRGAYEDALEHFSGVLMWDQHCVDALSARGLSLTALGRCEEALACFEQALQLDPRHAGSLVNRGLALIRLGRLGDAIEAFDRALEIDSQQAGTFNNRGYACTGLGRLHEALECYHKALLLQPGHVEALRNRGVTLTLLGQHAEALECFDAVLQSLPAQREVLSRRADSLLALGRNEEALAALKQVLEIDPRSAEALCRCGYGYASLGRHQEALACQDQALALNPRHLEAWNQRGLALSYLYRFDEALSSFQRALEIDPQHAVALHNSGLILARLERDEEALDFFERALAVAPAQAVTWVNRGVSMGRLFRLDEALASYERALDLDPEQGDARCNRAMILLSRGEFNEGFREYESRLHSEFFKDFKFHSQAPAWLGEQPVEGRRILLHHEQGLGDSIQFARYACLLAARGAHVVLYVPATLEQLMRTLPLAERMQIVSDGDPLPEHDLRCLLMSLPLALGTTPDTVPAEVPYLRAEPARSRHWADQLGPRSAKRIGVVWAGRQADPINYARDVPLRTMLPLFNLDADFISLQKDVPARDRDLLMITSRLRRFGELTADFADTAALVDQLDLVIAADTAVAHLAGALGKPVWIMNRLNSCWRWMHERSDSPWYPSARLFRQKTLGDWQGVLDEVRAAASAFVADRG